MNKNIVWNIRGIANAPSLRRIKKLVKINEATILAIIEPKVTTAHISKYAKKLHCTESLANTQNSIWIFWNNMTCQPVEVEDQYVSIKITVDASDITVVYARCDGRVRRDLSDKLINVNITTPWLL